MADFKLFSIQNGVKELSSSQVALERELQTLLEKNMMTFFGVTFLRSEYTMVEWTASGLTKTIVRSFLNISGVSMKM